MGLIRLVLALSVVFWHIPHQPFPLMNAAVAVTLFFIISGFYMAMVINEKYAPAGDGWIKTFYAARFWRLYPAYLAMVIVMIVWGKITHAAGPLTVRLPMSIFDQATLAAANIFLFGQDVHQFLVRVRVESAGPAFLLDFVRGINPTVLRDDMMLVGQAWSLAAEAMFYLVAPFIVRSARRTATCLALALAFRFFLLEICDQRSGIWGYFFFPGALCMFLLGSAAYHFRAMLPRPELHAIAGVIMLAGFAIWFAATVAVDGTVMPSPADWSIDRPSFWMLYLAFAASVPLIFQATKRCRFDREIGELSYPLYLVHGVILGVVFTRIGPQAVAAVGLSIIGAYAMRYVVEVPIERYRLAVDIK